MSTQPTPQPDQPVAQTEGTQAPVAAAPTPPPQTSGGMFDKVLGALSGNPRTYSVDPNTGKETGTPVTDRGTLAKHIVAAALVGLMKGAAARGPNSMGVALAQGGQAGFALGQQQNAEAKQAPLDELKRQQDIEAQKANALEKNLRMRNIAQTLSDADQKTHQQIVANYGEQLQELKDDGVPLAGEHVSEQEAKDPQKYGLTALRIPDGVVPKIGPDGQQVKDSDGVPQWEQTYTIVDSNAKVDMSDALVKRAQEWSIPGYQNVTATPGQQLSVVAASHVNHLVSGLQAMEAEVNGFRSKLGQGPIDLKAMIKADPSLIPAVEQFQRTSGASTQPDLQIDAMRQDQRANPYAGKIIGLFGADNLDSFKQKRTNDQAAQAIIAKGTAEAQTPEGKAKLAESQANIAEKRSATAKNYEDIKQKEQGAGDEWKPKVTADEKKKAELGENIAYNANEVKGLLAERPDLVGAVSGRFTNAEQMLGNNDKDIAAIGLEIQNIAEAKVGIHGMRSHEEVINAEQQILNHFKNGPRAVGGALDALTGSVQTFIDNARPEGFQTHSKKGGAAAFYQQAKPIPIFANAPGKPRIVSRDGGKTWQPVQAGAQIPDNTVALPATGEVLPYK